MNSERLVAARLFQCGIVCVEHSNEVSVGGCSLRLDDDYSEGGGNYAVCSLFSS